MGSGEGERFPRKFKILWREKKVWAGVAKGNDMKCVRTLKQIKRYTCKVNKTLNFHILRLLKEMSS